jgi:hypothetical protein
VNIIPKNSDNRKIRKKIWVDNRSRKIQLNFSKKPLKSNSKKAKKLHRNKSNHLYTTVIILKNFSLVENIEDTIACFEKIDKKQRLNVYKFLKLDFSEVENLTIDAIDIPIIPCQN